MKVVNYWVADDGTIFDDYHECEMYEHRKRFEKYKDDFLFFDCYKRQIDFENINDPDNVHFIVVRTEQVADCIEEWFKERGYNSPFCDCKHRIGTYVYGEHLDIGEEWVKLEKQIAKMQILMDKLNFK